MPKISILITYFVEFDFLALYFYIIYIYFYESTNITKDVDIKSN